MLVLVHRLDHVSWSSVNDLTATLVVSLSPRPQCRHSLPFYTLLHIMHSIGGLGRRCDYVEHSGDARQGAAMHVSESHVSSKL